METGQRWKALRWMIAVALFAISFFGRAPYAELDWLFYSGGKLALLLVGLGIGFWAHIWPWLQERFARVRPVSKRRLKREALRLASDMHSHAAAHRAKSTIASITEHRTASRQMRAAASEEESQRIWDEHMVASLQSNLEETTLLQQEFGGRVSFVLNEFERRGLLSGPARILRHEIEWESQSAGWISSAASKVEGL